MVDLVDGPFGGVVLDVLINGFDFFDDFEGIGSGGLGITQTPGKNSLEIFDASEMSGVVSIFH